MSKTYAHIDINTKPSHKSDTVQAKLYIQVSIHEYFQTYLDTFEKYEYMYLYPVTFFRNG